jgi:hypothetical protein
MTTYYEANREKKLAYQKAYYQAHKERCKALSVAWQQAHPERVNAIQKMTYYRNRERRRREREAQGVVRLTYMIDKGLRNRLDYVSKSLGITQSELVNEAIRNWLTLDKYKELRAPAPQGH